MKPSQALEKLRGIQLDDPHLESVAPIVDDSSLQVLNSARQHQGHSFPIVQYGLKEEDVLMLRLSQRMDLAKHCVRRSPRLIVAGPLDHVPRAGQLVVTGDDLSLAACRKGLTGRVP